MGLRVALVIVKATNKKFIEYNTYAISAQYRCQYKRGVFKWHVGSITAVVRQKMSWINNSTYIVRATNNYNSGN